MKSCQTIFLVVDFHKVMINYVLLNREWLIVNWIEARLCSIGNMSCLFLQNHKIINRKDSVKEIYMFLFLKPGLVSWKFLKCYTNQISFSCFCSAVTSTRYAISTTTLSHLFLLQIILAEQRSCFFVWRLSHCGCLGINLDSPWFSI